MTNIKLLALPIVLIIVLGVYSCTLTRKNARIQANLDVLEKTVYTLKLSLQNQYTELKTRQNELDSLQAKREEQDRQYEQIKKDDPETCDWSATRIPDPVLKFLCQDS